VGAGANRSHQTTRLNSPDDLRIVDARSTPEGFEFDLEHRDLEGDLAGAPGLDEGPRPSPALAPASGSCYDVNGSPSP
jgi:hypothetical protein